MNELLNAFEKENFFPKQVIPDGKIHRFKRNPQDKNQNAWYVAHQNNSPRGGENFYVALWGDWSEPGCNYKYCSLTTQSSQDKALIEEALRKAERKRIQEQERVWEETSIKAIEQWDLLDESGVSEYLLRKCIDGFYGAKISKNVLCVPVTDFEGKIWGIQKIYADGKKMFMAGTKKKGNFHVIESEDEDSVYVCEGFATACSIHMATGKTVYVAFDAGNLFSVCESIRKNDQEVTIIVCGDDDRWTENNPGRTMATKASTHFLGKALFPVFKDDSSKPTDFNDLHVLEGISKVKEQLIGIKPEKHYIVALGHKGATYYYTSNRNKQIMPLIAHGADQLLDLQPLQYWEQLYQNKQGVDWKEAQTVLKQQCWAKGIFNQSNIRGLGVWSDAGRTVIHLGNRLWVDGVETGLHDLKTQYIYSLEETQGSLTGKPLGLDKTKILVDMVRKMAWARNQDHAYFLGWIVASMVCGILPWRPHMWLVGGSGTGKTTIYELLGKLNHYKIHNFGGGTTEAGLRRSVRGSAVAVIFDEFELNNVSNLATNQSILAFMRQASSDTVAKVVKAEGQSGTVSYDPRFCAFVSGIRPTMDNEADRNRFTMVELDKSKQDKGNWAEIVGLMRHIDADFAQGLFMRSVSFIDVFLKNRATIEQSILERYYSRFAQQFAPILAGYVLMIQDSEISKEDSDMLVESFCLETEVNDIKDQNDEMEAVNHLLNWKMKFGDLGDRTVLELINYCASDANSLASDILMRHGLRYGSDRLFISNKNPELSKVFSNTRFQINWRFSFGRIAGSYKNESCRIFGKVCKGISIPINSVI